MPKIGKMTFRKHDLTFWMDGDRFTVITPDGKRIHIADEELQDVYDETLCVFDKSFDSGIIGLEPGRPVRIPITVLHTRDMIRAQMPLNYAKKLMCKIGETFQPYGCIDFLMFGDLLLVNFENEEKIIRDEEIQKLEDGFYAPAVKGIPEKLIPIPEDVLTIVKSIRAERESERHRKPIGTKDGFEFFLNDDMQLIVKLGDKEITADDIETIYGRPALNIEAFNLDHPFIELGADVAEAFRKAKGNKIPEGLKIVPAGRSLLDGAEWYKLDKPISEEAFSKVKMYFDYFGEASADFSGWLTREPGRVAEVLKIEF